MTNASRNLLHVSDLKVTFATPAGSLTAVDGLGLELDAGEALGIVGESGSGKTQTALAIFGLLAANGRAEGSIRFRGQELLGMARSQLNAIRGAEIGMVFQDPLGSLNPHLTVGTQMAEVLVQHRGLGRAEALRESARMLDAVRIADPARRLAGYPHELSGGMRQRLTIAMALLCRPKLLLADEPTSALDVTIQAQILALLAELRREFGVAVLLIAHDLGIVAQACDRVLVLYAGRPMEQGAVERVLARPSHPYTLGLLRSRPRLDLPPELPLDAIAGQPPDLLHPPAGCPFEPRCAFALDRCRVEAPPSTVEAGVQRACHARAAELR
ncbi:MAG: ATP-binding cassette domain-containing protein [Gammaproteobacteria bacterium]|nr:ATP-binding cassette domain-containing protein [Gammaproteobacteria bacterium]